MDPVSALRQIAYYKDRAREDPRRVMAYRNAADVVAALTDAQREQHGAASMTGALDRLYEIAEQHKTPAVMKQLMRNARISGDPTVRYSMGGFLLELTGHTDTRYTFDPNIRPHLLDLNSDDYKTYKAAVAWLEAKVANPKQA